MRAPLTMQGAQRLRQELDLLKTVKRPEVITAIAEGGYSARPFGRVVGADTYTPLAGAAFMVIPGDDDIVAAAEQLANAQ